MKSLTSVNAAFTVALVAFAGTAYDRLNSAFAEVAEVVVGKSRSKAAHAKLRKHLVETCKADTKHFASGKKTDADKGKLSLARAKNVITMLCQENGFVPLRKREETVTGNTAQAKYIVEMLRKDKQFANMPLNKLVNYFQSALRRLREAARAEAEAAKHAEPAAKA